MSGLRAEDELAVAGLRLSSVDALALVELLDDAHALLTFGEVDTDPTQAEELRNAYAGERREENESTLLGGRCAVREPVDVCDCRQ